MGGRFPRHLFLAYCVGTLFLMADLNTELRHFDPREECVSAIYPVSVFYSGVFLLYWSFRALLPQLLRYRQWAGTFLLFDNQTQSHMLIMFHCNPEHARTYQETGGLVGSSVGQRSTFGQLLRKMCRAHPRASVTLPSDEFEDVGREISKKTNPTFCVGMLFLMADLYTELMPFSYASTSVIVTFQSTGRMCSCSPSCICLI